MRLKKNYYEDIRYFDESYKRVLMVVFIAFLMTIPFLAEGYLIFTLNVILINIIITVGFNILMGYTGLFSLGHAAFMAIGAYSSVLLYGSVGFPYWLCLILSGIIAMLAGMIIAIPALRLHGIYLAIATMSFAFIIEEIIVRWESLTHGLDGIATEDPSFGSLVLSTDQEKYYLILFITILLTCLAKNIVRSNFGRAFAAIRDNDVAAETMGINLAKYKIIAFGISAFYAGVGGSLFAHLVGYISPENFGLLISIGFLVMVTVGGPASIRGSILGALLISFLPEGIRLIKDFFPSEVVNMAGLQGIAYGAIIIGFIMFEPQGLNGIWLKLKLSWSTFPFGRKIKSKKLMVHGIK